MRSFLLAVVLLLALAPRWAHAEPRVDYEGLPEDKAFTLRALQEVYKACPRLRAAKPDIEKIRLVPQVVMSETPLAAFGWKISLLISVSFTKQSPTMARGYLPNAPQPQMKLSAGGGARPGIVILLDLNSVGCATSRERDGTLLPVPALRFLSRWPSDDDDRPAKPLDSTAHPLR